MVNVLSPQVEPAEEPVRKLEQAARFVPLENLALCNNCGFAGTAAEAYLNEDLQLKKRQRMVEVKQTVWPGRQALNCALFIFYRKYQCGKEVNIVAEFGN